MDNRAENIRRVGQREFSRLWQKPDTAKMAEQTQGKSKADQHARKYIWLAVISSLLVIAAVLIYPHLNSPSVEERLAAIEAARAIPDSENAATIYSKLLRDANATSLLESRPAFLDNDSDSLTFGEPWSGKDYPELAAWIKERQGLIDGLLAASEFEKCRFPIFITPYRLTEMKRFRKMRKWAFVLKRAVNNDIGEGRIDDAIAKWRCLIKMGRHLRQQPLLIDYLAGISFEAFAVNQTTRFLVEGDANEKHLQKIESLPLQTQDDWAAVLDRILPVEELAEQRFKEQVSLLERLKYEFGRGGLTSRNDYLDRIHSQYLSVLASSRGIHILVALRRYRNEHGHWPGSLDKIQSQVPAQMLVDPLNNGDFVYRLTDDSFVLYSKGQNSEDEDGQYQSRPQDGPDDWPIWPPRGRKTQEETADGE
jgi:hypothetical protein